MLLALCRGASGVGGGSGGSCGLSSLRGHSQAAASAWLPFCPFLPQVGSPVGAGGRGSWPQSVLPWDLRPPQGHPPRPSGPCRAAWVVLQRHLLAVPLQPSPGCRWGPGGVWSPLSVHCTVRVAPPWGRRGSAGPRQGHHHGWGVPLSLGDLGGALTFRPSAPASLHLGPWLLPAPEPGVKSALPAHSAPQSTPTHTRGCSGDPPPLSPGPLSGNVSWSRARRQAGALHRGSRQLGEGAALRVTSEQEEPDPVSPAGQQHGGPDPAPAWQFQEPGEPDASSLLLGGGGEGAGGPEQNQVRVHGPQTRGLWPQLLPAWSHPRWPCPSLGSPGQVPWWGSRAGPCQGGGEGQAPQRTPQPSGVDMGL